MTHRRRKTTRSRPTRPAALGIPIGLVRRGDGKDRRRGDRLDPGGDHLRRSVEKRTRGGSVDPKTPRCELVFSDCRSTQQANEREREGAGQRCRAVRRDPVRRRPLVNRSRA